MAKAMIFIDGTWLYTNTPRLSELANRKDYHIDFGKLPKVLATQITERIHAPVDLVRTYLFGSYASNFDRRDADAVQRRLDFFNMLREEHHYEVETFPINFFGRRLRRIDREPGDNFEPREKCVDIAMATALLTQAFQNGYDLAVGILGDLDFKPVLQEIRRIGRRVQIVSIRTSCAPEIADTADPQRIKDFDTIWLEDLVGPLELTYERHQRQCESPSHKGDRLVWTTFRPRKGQRFYCDACRAEFHQQKMEALEEYVTEDGQYLPAPDLPSQVGEVKKKVADRGYGFIQAQDGYDYFFHLTDLEPGLDFLDLNEGTKVTFTVKRTPSSLKAGAAQFVRRAPSSEVMMMPDEQEGM